MRNPLRAYYDWSMRATGGHGPNLMLLFSLPLVILLAIAWLVDLAEPGALVLYENGRIDLSPAGIAGWIWLIGSAGWIGYFLWRSVRALVRGYRAGWRNEPLPRVDD